MPVTIGITKDIRFQRGTEQGRELEKFDNASKMLKAGIDISLVQNITGLEMSKLAELVKSLKANS